MRLLIAFALSLAFAPAISQAADVEVPPYFCMCQPIPGEDGYGSDCVCPPDPMPQGWPYAQAEEPAEPDAPPPAPEPKPAYKPGDWKEPVWFTREIVGSGKGTAGPDHFKTDGWGKANAMEGLGGDDHYDVNSPNDKVTEAAGAGTDVLYLSSRGPNGGPFTMPAHVENVKMRTTFTSPPFHLIGNDLDNVLEANPGASIVDGGKGRDKLIGGTGPNTFVLKPGEAEGDWIDDLKAEDRIELRGFPDDATLTNDGDVWSLAYGDKIELVKIRGVTKLGDKQVVRR